MADAHEPPVGALTRAERSSRTRELLAEAAASADPERRRAILAETSELNACVAGAIVASVARRYRYAAIDLHELAAYARQAYTDTVLSLEPTPDLDLLASVVPAVRDAVRRYMRSHMVMGSTGAE